MHGGFCTRLHVFVHLVLVGRAVVVGRVVVAVVRLMYRSRLTCAPLHPALFVLS